MDQPIKKYSVDVIQRRTYSFIVEATDEEDAQLKAYDKYCDEIESGVIDISLIDEDIEYEDIYEYEEENN